MAVESQEEHADRSQRQREPIGRPSKSSREPALLQQRRQNRQRRRLGRRQAQIQRPLRRTGRQGGRGEQGDDGDKSVGGSGGVIERRREVKTTWNVSEEREKMPRILWIIFAALTAKLILVCADSPHRDAHLSCTYISCLGSCQYFWNKRLVSVCLVQLLANRPAPCDP